MRTAFEEDEDIRHDEDDREVTLSSTTVLLIFFGLVLVCGLCFGLGYTLGHRSTPEGAISAPVLQQAAPLVASTSGQPKPSAAAVTPAPISDTPANASDGSSNAETKASEEAPAPKPAAHEPNREPAANPAPAPKPAANTAQPQSSAQVRPALVQTAQTSQPQSHTLAQLPVPTASPANASPTPVPAGIMVQVAAISNPTDAQVLVGALRKHGYSASIHNQPSDSLLHVQVGPFASRAEAAAMKQKLLSDGYNAILK